MRSPTLESRVRATLLVIRHAAAGGAVVFAAIGWALGWHRELHSVEDWRVRVLLTLIGLAVAAAIARWLAYASRVFPRFAVGGLVAWSISSVCYVLLVWTSLKIRPPLWRIWWVSLVLALAVALATALRLPATGRRGLAERAAAVCLVLLAIMLASLAVRADVLATPGMWLFWVALPLAAVVLVGSLVARVRFTRTRARQPVRRWHRVGWVVAGQAALLVIGFYAGRVTRPQPDFLDGISRSSLAAMTDEQVERQVAEDLVRVRALSAAIDDLRGQADTLHRAVAAARQREGRPFHTPAEADELRPLFMGYLACRDGLLRVVAAHCGFQHVRDPDLRARSFLVGFCAGSTVYAASLKLLALGDDPVVRRKLNEAEPAWQLEPQRFDEVYRNVASERTGRTFEEMAAYHAAHKDEWARANVLPPPDLEWLMAQTDRAVREVRLLDIDGDRARRRLLLERVRSDAYDPLYSMQRMVSTWIGDTRLVARPSFITPGQIEKMAGLLRPGDILLERRNWFASNAFLPGFWPHAALYIGNPQDLERLGVIRRAGDGWTSDDPAVERQLASYLRPGHDGQPHTVVESVSEGVIFNSLAESMAADYVAVLRPRRLSDADRAAAIRRAFAHAGKPYDFEFDFATSDKLVCTELVYQCYDSMLDFDCDPVRPGEQLPEIMGRHALPALEFCRKFARERSAPDRELDLVMFLDAVPAQRRSREATEDEFCASADRPKGFNE